MYGCALSCYTVIAKYSGKGCAVMREEQFKDYLCGCGLGRNGVAFRMSKARNAEDILGSGLDAIVADDERMYQALVRLQEQEDPKHNPMQNALRYYYKFCNGREFPTKKAYERQHGLSTF